MINLPGKEDASVGNSGLMYAQLKKFIKVIDDLRDVGVH